MFDVGDLPVPTFGNFVSKPGVIKWSMKLYAYVLTALHGMQTRSSDKNSVCLSVRPSVCPSVTRVDCDKTVERSVQIYVPYKRTFSLVF